MGNFKDTDSGWPDLAEAERGSQAAVDYFDEVSYGKLQMSFTVRDWYKLPISRGTTCSPVAVANELVKAADQDVDFRQFDNQMLLVIAPFAENPKSKSCSFGGIASVRLVSFSTDEGVVRMQVAAYRPVPVGQALGGYVFFHEIGHNLIGPGHANWYYCPVGQSFYSRLCTRWLYEDPYDNLGGWFDTDRVNNTYSGKGLGFAGHYDAHRKSLAGWLNPTEVATVTKASKTREYTIRPIEWRTSGLRAVRIQRSSSEYTYLEYRQPVMEDGVTANSDGRAFSESLPNVFTGALIYVARGRSETVLLDAFPRPTNSNAKPVLGVGQTLTDPVTGSRITVLSRTSSELRVRVSPPLRISKETVVSDNPAFSITNRHGQVSGNRVRLKLLRVSMDIRSVEFLVDERRIAIDTTRNYAVRWDSRIVRNGSHVFSARVTLTDNQVITFRRYLRVHNKLQAWIDGPRPNTNVRGRVEILPRIIGGSTIRSVSASIDNQRVAIATVSPYRLEFDSSNFQNGIRRLKIVVRDVRGARAVISRLIRIAN